MVRVGSVNILGQHALFDSEYMSALKHKIVGDQACKLQIFLNHRELIDRLINVDSGDVNLKVRSLDLLLSLMNLEVHIRNELDYIYAYTATKILESAKLDGTVPIEVCHKTVELLNLCLNNCGFNYKNSDVDMKSVIPKYFPKLLVYYISHDRAGLSEQHNLITVRTIIELMTLMFKGKDIIEPSEAVLRSLDSLILSIVERYIYQLEFKYVIKMNFSPRAQKERYRPLINKGIQKGQPLPFTSVPQAVQICNPMDETLFWLSVILYIETFKKNPIKNSLWLNQTFTLFISSLLKSQNTNLRACAVQFLVTPYFFNPKKTLPMQPHQLWLPYLVYLVNYDDLPWWIDPLETLTELVTFYNTQNPLNNEIIEFLYRTNLLHGLITIFVKCLSLDYQTSASLSTITSCLKLFAQVTRNDEKCRLLLLEDNQLMQHVEHALQTHLDLLNMFLLNADKIQKSLEPEDVMPPFYTSKMTLQWVSLLRSFSRSVNSLRTRLRRTTLGEQFLQLAETIYLLLKRAEFASDELLVAEMEILSMVFAVISNFAMEFSNLQVYMVKHGVLQMAHDILVDPIFNDQIECAPEYARYKLRFPSENVSAVKINVLWMLKHLIYNSNTQDKLGLLKVIPMDTILEYINDKNWAVQEQCFQLIRNLTCNSRKVINILLYHFRDKEPPASEGEMRYSMRSTYLFEFLSHKLRSLDPRNPHQMGTLVSVIHIVVNFTVINESKRHMIIDQEEILEIVKTILSESNSNNERFCNNEDAKLGCIWMLTNLIWNSSFSNYTHTAPFDYTPTAPTSDSSIRPTEELRSAQFETGGSTAYSDDSDREFEDDCMEMDETGDFVRLSMSSPTGRNPALVRYRKLEKMGFYELVHERTFDEYLNVRERARTLLFHMDMLRKGGST
ncbi:glucose-induced degradation complex subunit VID28 Ecym_4392 [Eremothecium cymbalariae DBVPG|uniref:Armadillo-like helical domain-containing protein n=1 Tax=Eremothecium cymbalariae (strain CBS 270.75 / DBVPG 7215 / KCTC 17166 / NRRL Y-17582) TaxID=931890 RepID=G8JTU3_ERECY|nr:hypothetical protein Ecym_4392 [Eremothecium cymbalariae DBVPG\